MSLSHKAVSWTLEESMASGRLDCRQTSKLYLEILIIVVLGHKKASRRPQATSLGSFRKPEVLNSPIMCKSTALTLTLFLLPAAYTKSGREGGNRNCCPCNLFEKSPSQQKFSSCMSLLTCLLPAPHLPASALPQSQLSVSISWLHNCHSSVSATGRDSCR